MASLGLWLGAAEGCLPQAGLPYGLTYALWWLSELQSPVLHESPMAPLSPLQASCILQLVKHIQKLQAKDVPVAEEVTALFAGELNPVAPKAQKKVPVPEG